MGRMLSIFLFTVGFWILRKTWKPLVVVAGMTAILLGMKYFQELGSDLSHSSSYLERL